MVKILKPLSILLIVFMAVACGDKSAQFTIEGKIADADSSTIYLEKRELNSTTILDSAKLNSEGNFKLKGAAPQYPELYILRLNGQVINLAIDSIETVQVNATKKTFATDYTIADSELSQQLKTVVLAQYKASREILNIQNKYMKKEINESTFLSEIQQVAQTYKTEAQQIIFSDLKSPVAYFALFQKVGDLLFFDPYDKSDYRLFAAVATAWDMSYPDSQRAKQLKDFTLQAMKIRKQGDLSNIDIENVSEVNSQEYFKIELPDINSKLVSTSSLNGKVVLVDFTVYQADESPLHNIELNKLYNKYKGNLEIYQISLDNDAHFWKNAASNIPWVAVHESRSVNSPLLQRFNVQQLPAMYLIDKNGAMSKRLEPTDNIDAEINKLL